MPIRHEHASQGGAVLSGIGAKNLEIPGADRAPCCLGEPIVARKDLFEPFGEEHVQRLVQSVEQIRRRGVRKIARGIDREHVVPIEVRARQLRALRGGERLGADGVER